MEIKSNGQEKRGKFRLSWSMLLLQNKYGYVSGNLVISIDSSGLTNLVVQVEGSFVLGIGAEGSIGIYITRPEYGGLNRHEFPRHSPAVRFSPG